MGELGGGRAMADSHSGIAVVGEGDKRGAVVRVAESRAVRMWARSVAVAVRGEVSAGD